MSNNDIVNLIYSDPRYKKICKKIAKKSLLAEELHSKFICDLLELKDNRLIDAQNGGYLEVYCCGIIYNIWGKRGKVKSPLYEFTSDTDPEVINHSTPEYNIKYDLILDKAQDIVLKDATSNDNEKRYYSRTFFYSHPDNLPKVKSEFEKMGYLVDYTVRNSDQFSRKVKCNKRTIRLHYNKYLEYLRNELKDDIND